MSFSEASRSKHFSCDTCCFFAKKAKEGNERRVAEQHCLKFANECRKCELGHAGLCSSFCMPHRAQYLQNCRNKLLIVELFFVVNARLSTVCSQSFYLRQFNFLSNFIKVKLRITNCWKWQFWNLWLFRTVYCAKVVCVYYKDGKRGFKTHSQVAVKELEAQPLFVVVAIFTREHTFYKQGQGPISLFCLPFLTLNDSHWPRLISAGNSKWLFSLWLILPWWYWLGRKCWCCFCCW